MDWLFTMKDIDKKASKGQYNILVFGQLVDPVLYI